MIKKMKRIVYIISLLVGLSSCSEDDSVSLSISKDNLSFSAVGGEQVVDIISDGIWECEYSEDWILVRQQQNKIRVIVDENLTEEERSANIHILCNNEVRSIITVTQSGLILNTISDITIQHMGEEITLPIESNSDWSIENITDWIEAIKQNDDIIIRVHRNYLMSERNGNIIIKVGDISKRIEIKQDASPWYESFEMIKVTSGNFYMGAQKTASDMENYDESAYGIESPVHHVTVGNYSIGKFEVTQIQWVAAMGTNPSSIQGDNLPVENVSWDDVQNFINILNEKSGKTYRLPTEAEWEFAARGGNESEGFKYSGFSVIGACGWYYSNSEATTHDVGTKEANELGIYDMSGNVREWCNDWFDYYTSSDIMDPQGPNYGDMKVNRGGSWTTPAVNCRNSYRHTDFPNESSQDLGFRLVLVE